MHRNFLVAACIVLFLSLYTLQGAYAKPVGAIGQCERNDECSLGVLCINHTCTHCVNTSQCHQMVDHVCVNSSQGLGICQHKGILPVSWHDGVGYFLLSICSAVAGASGMGGGPIFVPILILTFGFEAEFAIPLSKIMIFGVAVSQFIINMRKKDPVHPERWLICYDVALLFVPMALFGTTVGVLLNLMFPSYVIVFSLFVVMMFSIAKTIINFVQIRRKALNARAAGSQDPDESLPVAAGSSYNERSSLIDAAKINSEPRTLYAKSITVWCILFLFLVWIFIVGVSVIKGGKTSTIHGVAPCSWGYWVLFAAVGPVMYLFTVAVGVWFRTRAESNEKLGIINTDEMEWNKRNTILFPWLSFAAGVAAGMMGVGAGVVLGPLLLELGMRPETGAATTAFMILFTSSSVTMQFLVLGRLPEAYAIPLCICGFLTCFIGKIGINKLVDKYGKPYFLVFTLIVFLMLSMLALGGLGIWQIVSGQTQMGFSTEPVCGK